MSWDGDGVLAGRYRRLGRIGQGGMGSVWRARDLELDREVAVKELLVPDQVTDQERLDWYARMDREARAAARLRHPGIVTVYDRVTGDDGRPWIVMELIEGRSLGDVLAGQGALPPREVAVIGLAMLDALSAAHAQGVVHRDVKPANVLLEGDRVLLTDFGIAALEGDATITRSGMVLGTPAYMSPEQVEGKPVTPASDLWSLAATLYAAVEGRRPFDGPSHGAVFVAIATRQPPTPRCGGPLAQALNGLLRKNPDERLHPAQVRDLLNAALNPTGNTAVDIGPPVQDRPQPRTSLLSSPVSDIPFQRHQAILIRVALVCAVLSMLTFLVSPWSEVGDRFPLEYYTHPSPGLLLVVVAFIVMCGLWFLSHRPLLSLGSMILILGALHVGIVSVYTYGESSQAKEGFGVPWALGTLAFMLAFTVMNWSFAGRVTAPPVRHALLAVAVPVEGVVALFWAKPVYELADWRYGMEIELDTSFATLLTALGVIWFGVQPFLWSSSIRTAFSRRFGA